LKLLFEQNGQNHAVAKLHGKINQKKRTKIYKEFREMKIGDKKKSAACAILLTTDLAARGIDIPDVDWIV
jgi:superfamily II DNA/RNA helicase